MSLAALWYALVALALGVYVVLDGYDLGAGIVHLLVARDEAERRAVVRSIGPVWDGNEVWLIAAGATVLFAFPALFATAWSGFYLPLTIVLWLVMGRAIGIEFRGHVRSAAWTPLFDGVFALSSGLLALVFGVALANVVRGVPMEPEGHFFEPLWTDLAPTSRDGILDGYTVLVGVAALAALAMHGALWVAMKTGGDLSARARVLAMRLVLAVALATALVTASTFALEPRILARFRDAPAALALPAIAVGSLLAIRPLAARGRERGAFAASCAFLAGMLASVAFGQFPLVLPSSTDPARALTANGAASDAGGLAIGLAWWVPGMMLAAGYSVGVHWMFRGKVSGGEGEEHY